MWNIVSDSSCDLRPCDFQSDMVRFETIPFRIQVGGTEYVDNDKLDAATLLSAMAAEKTASSTACPSPAAYARAFAKGERTVCFTISSSLSGSYHAALTGRELLLEEHPEKKVVVVDSRSTAGAMVLLIQRAKALMEDDPEGKRFEEICDELRLFQAAQRTCFTLESYDNLIKNGRMRPLVGTVLHTLGIHVTAVATPQGTIQVVSKNRGEVRMRRAMVEIMAASKDCAGTRVRIHHCNNPEGAFRLREEILKNLPVRSVETFPCKGLTTFYAMNKGLIVGY